MIFLVLLKNFFKIDAMRPHHSPDSQRGVVAILFVILFLLVAISLTLSVVPVFANTMQILKNISYSQQAYYAGEAGVEDVAYRITNGVAYPSSYSLNVGSGQTTVTVTTIGPSKTIESDGGQQTRIRKVQSVLGVASSQVSFYFASQVGSQGIISMGNSSSIVGNVFSGGNINGPGAAQGTITGTVQASGSSAIQNIKVVGDAHANTFSNCNITGTAYYVTSITNCPAHATQHIASQVQPQPLPITQAQIDKWKNDAAAGGTLTSYALGNGASGTLGPKKITGNVTLGNSATLTISGTLWITGTINLGNSDIIQLAPGYGAQSGLFITDGAATIKNGVQLKGSGQTGSYIMLLSTYGPGTAIDLQNGGGAVIFYAPNGTINVGNGGSFMDMTANGLIIGLGVTLTNPTGATNLNFSSGAGGSWQLTSWKEVP